MGFGPGRGERRGGEAETLLPEKKLYALVHSFFFIRTSNFAVEAEKWMFSIFVWFEPETFLNLFLSYVV